MTLLQIGLLGLLVLFVLIFLRFPISMALLIVGVCGYAVIINPNAALIKLGTDTFDNATIYSLSVIPMFMLMGYFFSASGLGRKIFDAVQAWFGHLRGGLAVATIAACTFFSAVSGSVVGTAVTIGKIAAPEMLARKYKDTLVAGCIAGGGTLGLLLPPSSVLVIYGAITEESIGRLFIAGIVPGIITAIALCITSWLVVRLKPELAPVGEIFTMKERMAATKVIWPVPVIFGLCMTGILVGIFTANEGGAFGAFLALVYAILTRQMSVKAFMEALQETAKSSAMIFLLIIGGMIFGNFLTVTRIPLSISNFVVSMELSPFLLALFVYFIYIIFGLFMDDLAVIIIFTNIFYPLMLNAGYSGIWFGIMTIQLVNIGLITPPVGAVSMVTAQATNIKIEKVYMGVTPFWITLIIMLIVFTAFPQLVTFLPDLMRG
jgi:tripartite ATP-independent transporter DctM subunit